MEVLTKIQSELKAPKNQYNAFGKYKYRSCEDILEAVKPLLKRHKCSLNISDEIKEIGGHIYVESVCSFYDSDINCIQSKASAGIDPTKKGMDLAQCFGSASSYARKYALNGLFLIDDTKEIDSQPPKEEPTEEEGIKALNACKTLEDLSKCWTKYSSLQKNETFKKTKDLLKETLSKK